MDFFYDPNFPEEKEYYTRSEQERNWLKDRLLQLIRERRAVRRRHREEILKLSANAKNEQALEIDVRTQKANYNILLKNLESKIMGLIDLI